MAKTFFLVLALTILGSAAQAQTPSTAPQAPAAAKGQDYWLSNGLNRLVFWKTPMQSGRSVATEPPKR